MEQSIILASFFLTESEAWQISAGHAFLSCYTAVAKKAFDGGYCLCALKPVLHLFAHTVFGALQPCSSSKLPPVASSTPSRKVHSWQKIWWEGRLSRRVSAKTHGTKIVAGHLEKERVVAGVWAFMFGS